MTAKVGLIVGREWAFPPALVEEVNRRPEGVVVEYVKIGGTRMGESVPYAVLVDRISHEVPYYRTYVKHAAAQGVVVVNDPFMWAADDKFLDATLADRLGVAHPRTVVLPNKDYVPGIVPHESLRNLVYPVDWEGIIGHVGLPCILKDAHGGGWRDVYVCQSLGEVLYHYNHSGRMTMVVQEFIDFDRYVRCVCLGRADVLVTIYDPKERRYRDADPVEYLGRPLFDRVVADTLALNRALGYDMNSAEFAVRDGVPYAIDFMNPSPDFDPNNLGPAHFRWAVEKTADLVIRRALEQAAGRAGRTSPLNWPPR